MQDAKKTTPLTARKLALLLLIAVGAGLLSVLFGTAVALILDQAGYTLSTNGEHAVRLGLLGLLIGWGPRYLLPRLGLRA